MEECISVIVPVYNIENYVERCLDSIINQTYSDLQIIIVDDGSTDDSGKKCDAIALKDRRITVIHQENGGLGAARNAGLEIAKGKYVTFVDGDDWIEPNTYEILHKYIVNTKSELATCARKTVSNEGVIEEIYALTAPIIVDKREIIKRYLLQDGMNMSACDKLFLRQLFIDIKFPCGYVSEDILPIFEVLLRANRCVLTGIPLYNYYTRNGSLSKSMYSERQLGIKKYSEEVVSRLRKLNPELEDYIFFFEIDRIIAFWRILRRSGEKNQYYYEVKDKYLRNLFRIIKNPFLSYKHKGYVVASILGVDLILDKWVNR